MATNFIVTEVGSLDRKDKNAPWGYIVKVYGIEYSRGTRPTEKAAHEAAREDAKIASLFANPSQNRRMEAEEGISQEQEG